MIQKKNEMTLAQIKYADDPESLICQNNNSLCFTFDGDFFYPANNKMSEPLNYDLMPHSSAVSMLVKLYSDFLKEDVDRFLSVLSEEDRISDNYNNSDFLVSELIKAKNDMQTDNNVGC